MIDNVVISEVYILMYVLLSRAEIHIPYGELFGTAKTYNVINEASQEPRSS
jgi:hypothetical protein